MLILSHHEAFLRHDTGPGHPESPDRLTTILSRLEHAGIMDSSRLVTPREATEEEIGLVHRPVHFETIRLACERTGHIDGDTHVGRESFCAALLAAGATLAVADAVMAGPDRRGLCLVRPPGHHATPAQAMGFCLFNNAAICAAYLRANHRLGRVAVIDFDVHHGNGTQDAFADDEDVLYLSTHRYPFYPGTGGPFTIGKPPKATLNFPLEATTPPERFHEVFEAGMAEVEAFAPEAIVVSAGFDAHRDDPVGGLNLSVADFARITERIVAAAERTASGRIVSTLEGGYGLSALGASVEAHAGALTGV